jgi:hypothetical protein
MTVSALTADAETDFAPVDPPPQLFAALIDAYREQGEQIGYRKAMRDVLDALVPLTERFLRQADDLSAEHRKLIYRYVELFEREVQTASLDAGYVTGGLGI